MMHDRPPPRVTTSTFKSTRARMDGSCLARLGDAAAPDTGAKHRMSIYVFRAVQRPVPRVLAIAVQAWVEEHNTVPTNATYGPSRSVAIYSQQTC